MNFLVVLESPYAGETPEVIAKNEEYARACVADCFKRGEFAIASHLLYTQPGILNDKIPAERRLGIEAGLAWGERGDYVVVYGDRGISSGMHKAIEHWEKCGKLIEHRFLGGAWAN